MTHRSKNFASETRLKCLLKITIYIAIYILLRALRSCSPINIFSQEMTIKMLIIECYRSESR